MSEESKQTSEPPTEDGAANVGTSAETSTESTGKGKGKVKAEEKIVVNKKAIEATLKANPALAAEMAGKEQKQIEELFKKLKVEDLLTGLAPTGRNQKDMSSYKFWQTQPVPRFDEVEHDLADGPLQPENPEPPTSPAPLLDNFEWVTMDLTDETQMTEVYQLLSGHYVEDNEAMFRFNYSPSFLNWALKSPGWHSDWHVGVRVKTSKKLVAFISGIPITLRIRESTIRCSEINFLCVHKKLRAKRLTPVLIKEITRRCHLKDIWNAVYTAGIILPTPVSTCRYFHRSLDWLKLYEAGFSPLPGGSTKAKQITKYSLPENTSTKGLRLMEKKDVEQVKNLLNRYLSRFDLAPEMDLEDIEHWLLHKDGTGERVVWTYVVEDPTNRGRITDFFSFYSLESSVIGSEKHDLIKAAYLFYYASETALQEGRNTKKELGVRLNSLIHDALILAKKLQFDVFNALTLLDNTLFLDEQKFGAGDGQLHYYLFNWRTKPIRGGIDKKRNIDADNGSGVGLVML